MKPSARLVALALLALPPLPAVAAPIHAVLFKNPECSCCEDYAAYLQKSGFEVEIKSTNDLESISQNAGIPANLQGCHTMMVDGYAIDGLVPVDIVQKLLKERPPIAGITLPGMPSGAPGMGGAKKEKFIVYAITKDGKAPTVYATE